MARCAEPNDVFRDRLLAVLLGQRTQFVEVARSIVRCRVRAEDVVQDVAVKICQQRVAADVVEPGRFLMRMVRNLAIDALRQTRRECHLSALQEDANSVVAGCDCPLRLLGARQGLQCVLKALDAAPPRAREAFLAHRIDGISQKDIAARLGVSTTLVNFMIRDATALCREAAA